MTLFWVWPLIHKAQVKTHLPDLVLRISKAKKESQFSKKTATKAEEYGLGLKTNTHIGEVTDKSHDEEGKATNYKIIESH